MSFPTLSARPLATAIASSTEGRVTDSGVPGVSTPALTAVSAMTSAPTSSTSSETRMSVSTNGLLPSTRTNFDPRVWYSLQSEVTGLFLGVNETGSTDYGRVLKLTQLSNTNASSLWQFIAQPPSSPGPSNGVPDNATSYTLRNAARDGKFCVVSFVTVLDFEIPFPMVPCYNDTGVSRLLNRATIPRYNGSGVWRLLDDGADGIAISDYNFEGNVMLAAPSGGNVDLGELAKLNATGVRRARWNLKSVSQVSGGLATTLFAASTSAQGSISMTSALQTASLPTMMSTAPTMMATSSVGATSSSATSANTAIILPTPLLIVYLLLILIWS